MFSSNFNFLFRESSQQMDKLGLNREDLLWSIWRTLALGRLVCKGLFKEKLKILSTTSLNSITKILSKYIQTLHLFHVIYKNGIHIWDPSDQYSLDYCGWQKIPDGRSKGSKNYELVKQVVQRSEKHKRNCLYKPGYSKPSLPLSICSRGGAWYPTVCQVSTPGGRLSQN